MAEDKAIEDLKARYSPDNQNRQQAAFFKVTAELKAAGHKAFGADEFDRSVRAVAKEMGGEFDGLCLQVAQRDNAPRIMHKLGEDRRALEDLKSLPVHRPDVALANMDSQWSSHGHLSTAGDPAWMSRANRDKPGARDWSHGNAWETASWKDIDDHLAERARTKRNRGW